MPRSELHLGAHLRCAATFCSKSLPRLEIHFCSHATNSLELWLVTQKMLMCSEVFHRLQDTQLHPLGQFVLDLPFHQRCRCLRTFVGIETSPAPQVGGRGAARWVELVTRFSSMHIVRTCTICTRTRVCTHTSPFMGGAGKQ